MYGVPLLNLAALTAASNGRRYHGRRSTRAAVQAGSFERVKAFYGFNNNTQNSFELPRFDYCVLEESKQDPELGSFFSSLDEELVLLKNKRLNSGQSLGQTFELLKKYDEETNKIEQELVASGVILGKESSFVFFPINNQSGSIKQESITVKTYKSFNGLDLSLEDIRHPERLRKKYEEKKSFCDDLVSEEKSLNKQLSRLKRKLSFSPFGKTDTEEEIRRIEARLFEIDMAFSEEDFLASQLETFEKIPDEKKQLIGKYLEAVSLMEKGIESYEDEKESFSDGTCKYSSDMVEEATRRVIVNTQMTEDQISRIFESLDKVKEKINSGAYYGIVKTGAYGDYYYQKRENLTDSIVAFIRHIYDKNPTLYNGSVDKKSNER